MSSEKNILVQRTTHNNITTRWTMTDENTGATIGHIWMDRASGHISGQRDGYTVIFTGTVRDIAQQIADWYRGKTNHRMTARPL